MIRKIHSGFLSNIFKNYWILGPIFQVQVWMGIWMSLLALDADLTNFCCVPFLFLTTTLWDQNCKLYLADERTKARVPMAKRASKKQRCTKSSPHPSPNCNHFSHRSNLPFSANTIICCLFIMRNIWTDIELRWSPFRHWTRMIEKKK